MRYNQFGVIAEVDDLPGCQQVGVSHYVWNPTEERGKGNGKNAHEARLRLMGHLGYDVAMATVDMKNLREIHILKENGWTFLTSFKSSKTTNRVGIYVKGIRASLISNEGIADCDKLDKTPEQYYEDYMNCGSLHGS